MTSYFDRTHEKLRGWEARYREMVANDDYAKHLPLSKELQEIENKLLFDCQLVAVMPGFPSELADQMQLIIARRSTEPLSSISRDFEDELDMVKSLHALAWDLHTLFHELGHAGIEPFTDKPDSILSALADSKYERRIELMRARPDEFGAMIQKYDTYNAKVQAELDTP